MTSIDTMPNLPWSDHAREEIAMTGPSLIDESDFSYQIGEVAIAGLIYHSYTSPPWFWFGLAKNARIRDLIDFRALREHIPVGSLTAVREDFGPGHRFATFYGFSPTAAVREYEGRTYILYRRD